MEFELAYHWIKQGERRQAVLASMSQPLTATQIANRVRTTRNLASDVLYELRVYDLCYCCNPTSCRSRVYRLTKLGIEVRKRLLRKLRLPELPGFINGVDCEQFGWASYSHRSAIIKALTQPTQAALVRKKAFAMDPAIRMSANNARDLLKLGIQQGIVKTTYVRKKKHPRFELTESGKAVQELLWQAETPGYSKDDILAAYGNTESKAAE